jgi:hypothetical protein
MAKSHHRFVKPFVQKYSDFQKTQISCISIPSRPPRGALAIVTDAGRDAMDADGVTDENTRLRTAKSCGPDASTLVSSFAEAISA